MPGTEVVEIPFGSNDFELSLEDNFTLTRIKNELEAVTDIEEIRKGAIMLLNLAVMRQSMIRGLIRRLADLELKAIRTPVVD
jgi:hypothetical protein